MAQKVAVILLNMGGPDSPRAIRPFLFNLFNDPAIIGAPGPVRWLLAHSLSIKRTGPARRIYARIGGRSPLLDLTERQAAALQAALNRPDSENAYRCFIAMRYWHPFTARAVAEAKKWGATRVVLLPLYPQYSSVTSGSSIEEWKTVADRVGFKVSSTAVCCYPTDAGFVAAQADLLSNALERAAAVAGDNIRVLFSAHGLPKSVVARGDPYPSQVAAGAAAIVRALDRPGLDWKIVYQSRVGPAEWIGPYADDEIRKAGAEGKGLVVLPIAFVSEHSETLVELDEDYRRLAEQAGAAAYLRVPALGCHPAFIEGLAGLVGKALAAGHRPCSERGGRLCDPAHGLCPNKGD